MYAVGRESKRRVLQKEGHTVWQFVAQASSPRCGSSQALRVLSSPSNSKNATTTDRRTPLHCQLIALRRSPAQYAHRVLLLIKTQLPHQRPAPTASKSLPATAHPPSSPEPTGPCTYQSACREHLIELSPSMWRGVSVLPPLFVLRRQVQSPPPSSVFCKGCTWTLLCLWSRIQT